MAALNDQDGARGLISVEIHPLGKRDPVQVARLAGFLIKGAVVHSVDAMLASRRPEEDPTATPLETISVDGSTEAVAALLRDVCIPRLVLQCAELRLVRKPFA